MTDASNSGDRPSDCPSSMASLKRVLIRSGTENTERTYAVPAMEIPRSRLLQILAALSRIVSSVCRSNAVQ